MALSIQEMTNRTIVHEENILQIDIKPDNVEKWRSEVTSDLESLKKRIEELERRTLKRRATAKVLSSFAESKKDNCHGFLTLVHLVRTNWPARLQCITLLLAITIFSYCAITFFLVARSNELAVWKPKKN